MEQLVGPSKNDRGDPVLLFIIFILVVFLVILLVLVDALRKRLQRRDDS